MGVVVGSSTWTGNADYTCDGTSDDVQINQAIAQVNSLGGGIVYLTPGTYSTTNKININVPHVYIMGASREGVKIVGAFTGDVIQYTDGSNAVYDSKITDVWIQTNGNASSTCIHWTPTGSSWDMNDTYIDHCYVSYGAGTAFHYDQTNATDSGSGMYNHQITRCLGENVVGGSSTMSGTWVKITPKGGYVFQGLTMRDNTATGALQYLFINGNIGTGTTAYVRNIFSHGNRYQSQDTQTVTIYGYNIQLANGLGNVTLTDIHLEDAIRLGGT